MPENLPILNRASNVARMRIGQCYARSETDHNEMASRQMYFSLTMSYDRPILVTGIFAAFSVRIAREGT